jgi:hypothetical protein
MLVSNILQDINNPYTSYLSNYRRGENGKYTELYSDVDSKTDYIYKIYGRKPNWPKRSFAKIWNLKRLELEKEDVPPGTFNSIYPSVISDFAFRFL